MPRQRRQMALSASNDVAGTWKHFFTSPMLATCYIIIHLHGAINSENLDRRGVKEYMVEQKQLSDFYRPPGNSAPPGTNKGHPNALNTAESRSKSIKTPPASLESASALPGVSATIGCNYVPDFDGAHLQGVQWDSLESFETVGARQVVDTPALCAIFARAASAIILCVS
jgi:hypothetical protein